MLFSINSPIKQFSLVERSSNKFSQNTNARFKLAYSFIGLLCSIVLISANKTFTGTGNFSDATKWGGTLPVIGDNLIINGTCTFDNAANNLAYGSLVVGNTVVSILNWSVAGTNTLSVTDISTLKAGSAIDMTNGGFLEIRNSWAAKNMTFTPGIGTIIWSVTTPNSLLPSSVSTYFNLITNTGGTRVSFNAGGPGTVIANNLTVSTGTLNSGGKKYTCSNTIYITSVMEDVSNAGTNTINNIVINSGGRLYNTVGETYNLSGNLTMLGGTILGAGIPILNVAGNFLVLSGTNDIGNSQLAVTGTTSVSATLNVSTTGGTKTLKDLAVNTGGSFNCLVAESWAIGGNIIVNGSLSANAGTYSLTGIGKTISGTTAITFSNVTCTGTYTNNANVSLTGSLIGLGTWAQGPTGVLNLGIPIPSFSVAIFNASAVGNLVNYSLAGNQTIRNPNDGSYYHLSSSTSATKSFTSNIVANGNLAINSSTLDVSALNFSLTVGGNWTNTAGMFTPRLGLVTFNSSSSQTIFKSGGETFNNITFLNSGNKSLLSAISGNTLTINAGSLTANSNSITLIGNWTNNGGTFVGGTGTVLFAAATPQTIFKASGETFNNITFSNIGIKSLLSAISCNTLTINTSTLIANSNNITLTGNWANNTGLFTPGTNTVFFTGTAGQTIFKSGGEVFNNITFSNAGNKSLLSAISGNTLTINAGILTANSNSITLTGDWTNNGGTFSGGTGTVLFTAATPQTIFKASGETFNNITFSNTGTKSLLSAISGNTLTINATILTANSNSITLTGNWANNAGTFVPGTGTTLFTGTTAQTIFKSGGEIFNNITFSNAGNKTLLSAITANTVTINAGSLTAGSNSITLTGDWTNNGGTFAGGTGTVFFIGTTLQNIFKATGETFNNITLLNSGNKSLLSAISGNTLTINATTLTANSNSITLIGNWANNAGTFVPGTGTTLFTGTAAQSILKAGGETFYDITFSNAGNKTLLCPITGNTLTINAGTLTSGSFSISLTGDWRNNGGTFSPGTGTTYFTGTTPQTIFKSGGETFNDVNFTNAGTKTLLSAITASNVIINTGSNLDVNTTNNQMTVKGNFTNSGIFNARKGLVFLNGTVAQTIGGTSITNFYNLTLNNLAGANTTSAENLINTLTLNNGTFNTNSQGFTMISTATNTARIAQITGTGDIIGNVNVQRYAPGGRTGWALLGTPISSALTFQDWDDDIYISCSTCPDGSAAGFKSIYYYNETAVGSYSASAAYIPLNSITNPITPNRGYWVYLGTAQYTTTPLTIDVTGTVRKFNNAIPLTRTNTGSAANDGWNLIHNPYPSPIKWSSLRNGNANVDNAVYSYNADLNGGTGASVAYVNGISSPALGAGGIGDSIPMCQGFQVHCTANTTLTALESYKVSGNPTFLKTNQTAQIASVQPLLRFYLDGPTSFHDETVLYMEAGATNNFDSEFDAIKMAGQDPSAPLIAFQNGTDEFQVNGIDVITSSFSMPLKTTTGHTGTYTISLANFNSFPTGACISLYDSLTGITTNLKTNNYVFNLNSSTTNVRFGVNITINPLSITSNISQPDCGQPNAGEITVVGNNTGPWNYIWKDVSGTIIKTSLNKTTADTLLNLTGGDYTIDINTVGQCDNNESTFTINVIDLVSAQFSSVDTTYLSSGAAVLFNNSSINSVNDSWDFGDGFGFSLQTNPSYNYSAAGIYTVSLIATSNSGCLDTAYKSIVVITDIVTGLTTQSSETFIVKTLNENEFLIQGVISSEEILNFKLLDALGKLIIDYGNLNSSNISLPVNLNNYKAGVYFLNVTGTKIHKTIKLPVK